MVKNGSKENKILNTLKGFEVYSQKKLSNGFYTL